MILVDTSAAAKAIQVESGSERMRDVLVEFRGDLIASRLLHVELHAFAWRRGIRGEDALTVLRAIPQIDIDDEVIDLAAAMPVALRSLDRIHLATALVLGDSLDGVLTFDRQMADSATALGIPLVELDAA